MVYLITGKAGAGKTYYAERLAEEFIAEGKQVEIIDGDTFRAQTNNNDFSDTGRINNLLNAAKMAKEYEQKGIVCILSFIAPRREWRAMMKSAWQESQLIYIPGGHLWENTIYETPDSEEFKMFNK